MLTITRSSQSQRNDEFHELPRRDGEGNAAWFERAAGGQKGGARLALFGGTDLVSARLRIAQSHARDDMTPSYWSHVALVKGDGPLARDARLYDLRLEPPGGLSSLITRNGVFEGALADYDDVGRFPNVALLALPLPPAPPPGDGDAGGSPIERAVEQFYHLRHISDSIELALAWIAFVCGVGRTPNPLLAGAGIPSAVFVEMVAAAAGFELTPALPNRSSCPEAIWQSARWWHDGAKAMTGSWCVQRGGSVFCPPPADDVA
jgi:hypothetical protein